MKILVIGSGGREHAITWKLAQSPQTSELHCAQGNAGIAEIATCHAAKLNDSDGLASIAESLGADLTVIGPEAPLVEGVTEAFENRKLRVVGPSMAAARLEGSKIFAKQFMARHSIPTARFTVCDSTGSVMETVERDYSFPIVVKADGLAAGKGVRIAQNRIEFEEAINAMMIERVFGDAGARVVLEECLVGREASLMIFADGRDFRALAPAQDYKRVYEGDLGPNTGGMGSFSTPDLIDEPTLARIAREIVEPTLANMAAEGNPFRGVLYVGLMLTSEGPKVIEYNVRLGDPETQAVFMRLDSDLVEIFEAILAGTIGSLPVNWSSDSSVCVVAAAGGYPGQFENGKAITGLDEALGVGDVVAFHAGTVRDQQGGLRTAGGRILGVTARAGTLEEARTRAYKAIDRISFDGMHYRKDLAVREG